MQHAALEATVVQRGAVHCGEHRQAAGADAEAAN